MNDQIDMKSVGFAWLGVLTSVIALQTAQIIVGLIAGTLTCVYTMLKIIEWFRANERK